VAAACLRLEVQVPPAGMFRRRRICLPNEDWDKGPMVSKVDRLRCDACGIEIPVEAIVGLDGSEAMTAEQYMNRLHTAGFGLFCEICIAGRDIAWEMTPGQPPNGVSEK
jgi:hypothetical protein